MKLPKIFKYTDRNTEELAVRIDDVFYSICISDLKDKTVFKSTPKMVEYWVKSGKWVITEELHEDTAFGTVFVEAVYKDD